MVKDSARQWTDKELEQMEKKISKIYKKSAKGITKSWTKFMSETESKVSKYQTAYDKAVESGDDSLIESTKKSLQSALTRQTLRNSYYKSMIDDVTTKLSQTNQIALAYVNNQMPSVYTKNFNFIGKDMDELKTQTGIKFNLVDEAVVKRRVLEGDIKLPKKKVDVPKDKKWNTKQLNSSVLQGILQGESMGEISKRILPVVNNNQTSAIRNARTMVTGAENQGRLDRYRDLAKRGAIIKKVWMATGDERTRDWHLSMDGQEQEIEEYFIDGLGQKLIMPADPDAPANTVYNCRCTTKSRILGFRKADGTVNLIDYDYSQDEESLHSKEIKAEQASRTAQEEKKVDGYSIAGKTLDGYTDSQKKDIVNIIEKSPERFQNVYGKYSSNMQGPLDTSQYGEATGHTSTAFYSSKDNRVYFDTNIVASGDYRRTPYETHFHEYGHNIDYLAGNEVYGNGEFFSVNYKRKSDGKYFDQLLDDEFEKNCVTSVWLSYDENIDISKGGMGADVFSKNLLNKWRRENGINRDDSRYINILDSIKSSNGDSELIRSIMKNNSDVFEDTYKKDFDSDAKKYALQSFCSKIKNEYSAKEYQCFSDMIERYSVWNGNGDYPLGIGHGENYYKNGKETNTAKEAFAEFCEMITTNQEALDFTKKYLPETYDMFEEMLEEMMK